MRLTNTTQTQDSALSSGEDLGNAVADVLGVCEDLDEQLTKALKERDEALAEVERLEEQLRSIPST